MKPELKTAIAVTILGTLVLNIIIYIFAVSVFSRTPNIIVILFISLLISGVFGWRYYRHQITSHNKN